MLYIGNSRLGSRLPIEVWSAQDLPLESQCVHGISHKIRKATKLPVSCQQAYPGCCIRGIRACSHGIFVWNEQSKNRSEDLLGSVSCERSSLLGTKQLKRTSSSERLKLDKRERSWSQPRPFWKRPPRFLPPGFWHDRQLRFQVARTRLPSQSLISGGLYMKQTQGALLFR